jgi:hypothetical protein
MTAEENVIDMDMVKKKRNDDTAELVDYGHSRKGKIRPNEESIETNWKSDRKKHSEIEYTEEENMTAESEPSSIDMYYRGKNKKLDNMFETNEDDFGKLKKVELVDESSPTDTRKNSYVDVIDEGSMKQKRLGQEDHELLDNEKKSSIELDIISANKKNKKSFEDLDSELVLSMKRKLLLDEEDAAKTKDKDAEDLGGYLKGSVSKETGPLAEPEIKIENEYDNSEIEKNDRAKDFDLDLLDGDKKDRNQETTSGPEDNAHEGEVDQIDTNMIGDQGTVDKIRTRMNGLTDRSGNVIEDEDESLVLYNKKASSSEKCNNF